MDAVARPTNQMPLITAAFKESKRPKDAGNMLAFFVS
jgi:hypothetical protein